MRGCLWLWIMVCFSGFFVGCGLLWRGVFGGLFGVDLEGDSYGRDARTTVLKVFFATFLLRCEMIEFGDFCFVR